MSTPDSSKQCVLIIDDDVSIRLILSTLLEMEGYAVKEAVDGQDALQKITASGRVPSLIVLDMMMPRLDGLGFLHWLRQEAGIKVPVVALTGMNKKGAKEQILAAGADRVLFKPVSPQDLTEAIRAYISPSPAGH